MSHFVTTITHHEHIAEMEAYVENKNYSSLFVIVTAFDEEDAVEVARNKFENEIWDNYDYSDILANLDVYPITNGDDVVIGWQVESL